MKREKDEAAKIPENYGTMTIKALAEKVKLTPRTIRYYEQIGILNGISRDPYNRRRYTERDLYLLKLVRRATKLLGLSLDEVKELASYHYQDPTEKKVVRHSIEALKKHIQKIDDQQKELQITRNILNGEIKRLESLFNSKGFDRHQ